MHRTLAVASVLLVAALAGCTGQMDARFPQADEVEHVVVNTGSYEVDRGDDHTVTLSGSTPLDPGNATYEPIVEHALPLLETVDEASLQQARIEWDSDTPGNGQPHVDLLFEDGTSLRWDTREPIAPAAVESMRVVLERANGTQPIVAVENEDGWHWWRTDASVAPIQQAAEPVIERAKADGRAREPVTVRGPGQAPACRMEPYSDGEMGVATLRVEGLEDTTLAAWNTSRVLAPAAYELDEANRTIHANWTSSDPVHLVLRLTADGQPPRLVLASCQWLMLGWADRPDRADPGILLVRGRDDLRIEHVDDACPKEHTGPQEDGSDVPGLVLTRIAPGEQATVDYLEEGDDACVSAEFTYRYQEGWRLVEAVP